MNKINEKGQRRKSQSRNKMSEKVDSKPPKKPIKLVLAVLDVPDSHFALTIGRQVQ
jgi:hypothetical protein